MLVLVDRGVVENVGEFAVASTYGEGVIGHRALGEGLAVARAGALGSGEVIGKVGADEFLARVAGDLDWWLRSRL